MRFVMGAVFFIVMASLYSLHQKIDGLRLQQEQHFFDLKNELTILTGSTQDLSSGAEHLEAEKQGMVPRITLATFGTDFITDQLKTLYKQGTKVFVAKEDFWHPFAEKSFTRKYLYNSEKKPLVVVFELGG